MKIRNFIVIAGLAVLSAGPAAAQYGNAADYTSAGDPVQELPELAPSRTQIVVGRYGYWRFQPVKMAYLTCVPEKTWKVPERFLLCSIYGRVLFSNRIMPMTNPLGVLAPVAVNYPGQKLYALNFSDFNGKGFFYLRIPGVGRSRLFHIGGPLPVDSYPLPSLLTFERQSGILPSNMKPIIDDSFLHTPFQYPVFETDPD